MKIQASLEFLLIGSAIAAMSLFLIAFYSKNLFSQTSALADIAKMPGNSSYYVQPPDFFINSTPTTAAYAQYSAEISGRDEKLSYAMSSPSYVTNLTQFSHCIGVGFYGHPFDIKGQCGTYNAWMYFYGYDCGLGAGAYCIMPKSTGYATTTVSGERSYEYGFSLGVSTPSGTLRAKINYANSSAAVFLNGEAVGHARIESVSSTDPPIEVNLLSNSGNYSVANQTYYSVYDQNKNFLFPLLAFYNGTGVSDPTAASIQQAIGAYAAAQVRLVASNGGAPSCSVSGASYVCNATSPFIYLINVTVSPSLGLANQTLSYLGSVIDVRSG